MSWVLLAVAIVFFVWLAVYAVRTLGWPRGRFLLALLVWCLLTTVLFHAIGGVILAALDLGSKIALVLDAIFLTPGALRRARGRRSRAEQRSALWRPASPDYQYEEGLAMGLKMRDTLFYGVEPAQVFEVYAQLWADLGHPLIVLNQPDPKQNSDEFDLYEPNNGWTILSWNAGWEWDRRRQAQLAVSRALGCAGLLTFVFDGDYWGYELFRAGVVLDRFVQVKEEAEMWFPGCDCRGSAEIFATVFPWLEKRDVAAYLAQDPRSWSDEDTTEEDYAAHRRLDVPARPGDEFRRFDGCALLDFWGLLGIAVDIRDDYVTAPTPIWRAFTIRTFDKLKEQSAQARTG